MIISMRRCLVKARKTDAEKVGAARSTRFSENTRSGSFKSGSRSALALLKSLGGIINVLDASRTNSIAAITLSFSCSGLIE